MITEIRNVHDIEHLRYDIIRTYNNPEFNGELKAFVIEQLDNIINGSLSLTAFISMQDRINKGICVNELNVVGC